MKWMAQPSPLDGNWHRWFAWRPVLVNGFWVWLERIERRADWCDWFFDWEYREIASNKHLLEAELVEPGLEPDAVDFHAVRQDHPGFSHPLNRGVVPL